MNQLHSIQLLKSSYSVMLAPMDVIPTGGIARQFWLPAHLAPTSYGCDHNWLKRAEWRGGLRIHRMDGVRFFTKVEQPLGASQSTAAAASPQF